MPTEHYKFCISFLQTLILVSSFKLTSHQTFFEHNFYRVKIDRALYVGLSSVFNNTSRLFDHTVDPNGSSNSPTLVVGKYL